MTTQPPNNNKLGRMFAMVTYAITNPKTVVKATVIITLLMCGFLPFASIDVDPENMLSADEPIRVFHNQMKKQMNINDLIVIGIENPDHPKGVFNPESLNRIHQFSQFLKTVTWVDEGGTKKVGIVTHNIVSPSQVDAIDAGEPGVIRFERLMNEPISTQAQAETLLKRAMSNPFLAGTMVSMDQKSLALYIPITEKSVSAEVYDLINDKLDTISGPEQYHITGLPLAEDVFGIDMFIQMAISAPLAMLLIFILILYFFRNAVIGASALAVAMASVLITMGAFVASGNTIHIMSSMIAIFLMPIAVLDATHILSMFFDKYQQTQDRKGTLLDVMKTLFVPMLNTSLTSAAGFFSLCLAPIPPIQVFGVFVGFGILLAWLLSMTLIPAYIMLLKPERLSNFGTKSADMNKGLLSNMLQRIAAISYKYSKSLMILIIGLVVASVYGIQTIKVNDNPMKWLHPTHPIRVADNFINDNFGGNYLVYLTFSTKKQHNAVAAISQNINTQLTALGDNEQITLFKIKMTEFEQADLKAAQYIENLWQFSSAQLASKTVDSSANMEDDLDDIFAEAITDTDTDASSATWQSIQGLLSDIRSQRQVFNQPQVLEYISRLQKQVEQLSLVGKSNSLADLVKKLNKELHDSD
ncbi:MAG: MMPL family transporter, partial [Psychrosphaera sp.]|nr:MMPL family transporter [Psychrosphaera sp.]